MPDPSSSRASVGLAALSAVVLVAGGVGGWRWQAARTAEQEAERLDAARAAFAASGAELAACLVSEGPARTVAVLVAAELDGAGLAEVRVTVEPTGAAPEGFSACAAEALWAQSWPAVEGGWHFADRVVLSVGGEG